MGLIFKNHVSDCDDIYANVEVWMREAKSIKSLKSEGVAPDFNG